MIKGARFIQSFPINFLYFFLSSVFCISSPMKVRQSVIERLKLGSLDLRGTNIPLEIPAKKFEFFCDLH